MVELFLTEPVKDAVLSLVALLIVLTALARRMPHVTWLQFFSVPANRTEQQDSKMRRSGNVLVGFEMILAGMAIPAVYLFSTMMFFNQPSRLGLLLVGVLSLLSVWFGMRVILKSDRGDR